MKIGFLHTKIRPEEKLLLEEFRKKGIDLVMINDDDENFDLAENRYDIDALYERSVSYSRGLYISKIFESWGIPVVNPSAVAERCGDKFVTSKILVEYKIPTPRVMMAFSEQSALAAIEKLGYPCVIKPVIGSWARMVSRINDRHAAEAIIEHKKVLGDYQHQIFYIQEYVKKPGRDIRAFSVGGKTICAIYRSSEHWITNTARGGKASNCPVTKEMDEICIRTSDALGGGVLAMDLFETENGLMVNEVNHTMEFRNSIDTTGVNIPEKVVEYVMQTALRNRK
jgi:[lysine-biosynthesis-protein LysW]---L-2-aminoadipate ligase